METVGFETLNHAFEVVRQGLYIYKICGTFGTQTIAYPDPEEQTINTPEELVS